MESINKKARGNATIALVGALFISLVCAGLITLAIVTHNTADEQERAWNVPVVAHDPSPNAPVTCDNVPMSPGETCNHVSTMGNGQQVTVHYSYEEQQRYQSKQRTQQELDRLTAQHNKLKPPFETTLTGCLSGFLWVMGVIAGLFALLFFISFIANVRNMRGSSQQAAASEPAEPEQNHPDEPTNRG